MSSLILRSTTRLLLPLLLLFSLFVLLRGHNEPGGGFIGGLLAAGGLALYLLAFGSSAFAKLLRVAPVSLVGSGLSLAALAAALPCFVGRPFLTGLWWPRPLPGIGKLSSILLFDIAVYLVVVGTTLIFVSSLAEEER
jgi:multicomponent Na+:H+ antiporter subunit B